MDVAWKPTSTLPIPIIRVNRSAHTDSPALGPLILVEGGEEGGRETCGREEGVVETRQGKKEIKEGRG